MWLNCKGKCLVSVARCCQKISILCRWSFEILCDKLQGYYCCGPDEVSRVEPGQTRAERFIAYGSTFQWVSILRMCRSGESSMMVEYIVNPSILRHQWRIERFTLYCISPDLPLRSLHDICLCLFLTIWCLISHSFSVMKSPPVLWFSTKLQSFQCMWLG